MADTGDDAEALIAHLRQRVAQLEQERARLRAWGADEAEVGQGWYEQVELRDETERIAKVGSWSWDLATGKVWWSRETYRILGYDPVAVQPSTERFFAALHPDDRARLEAHSAHMAETGDTTPARARVVHGDGSVLHVDFSSATLRDEGGNPRRIVGTMADQTQRVRNHERRRLINAHLEQVKKMEAIGRMASGVAHDVNNYLLVIDGNAELLARSIEGPELASAVADLRAASRSCSDLMQNLLTFSRDRPSGEGVHDLRDIVARVDFLFRSLRKQGVTLDVSIAETPLPVWGEASQIEQVVSNLLVNARDAVLSHDGERRVELSVRRRRGEADPTVTGAVELEWVALCVSDTGPGIAPDVLGHIFEPFYTTKPENQGTGLGLATVYAVATRGGGRVEVDSQPGCGASFCVLFPPAQVEDVRGAEGACGE